MFKLLRRLCLQCDLSLIICHRVQCMWFLFCGTWFTVCALCVCKHFADETEFIRTFILPWFHLAFKCYPKDWRYSIEMYGERKPIKLSAREVKVATLRSKVQKSIEKFTKFSASTSRPQSIYSNSFTHLNQIEEETSSPRIKYENELVSVIHEMYPSLSIHIIHHPDTLGKILFVRHSNC